MLGQCICMSSKVFTPFLSDQDPVRRCDFISQKIFEFAWSASTASAQNAPHCVQTGESCIATWWPCLVQTKIFCQMLVWTEKIP